MTFRFFKSGKLLISSLAISAALTSPAFAQTRPEQRQIADEKKVVVPGAVKAPIETGALTRKPAELAVNPSLALTKIPATTDWYDIGQSQFATPAYSRRSSSITAPNGDIYTTVSTDGTGLQIFKYDGRTWTKIPAHISARHFSWDVDSSSTLYVAFQNTIDPPHYSAIHVKKLVGNTWQRVGTTRMKGATRAGAGVNFAIDRTTDVMYLTYGNGNHEVWPRHSKITVRRFDGTDWTPVGPEQLSRGGAGCFTVKANNSSVFLTYAEEQDDGRPKVYKLNGNSWQPYGNGFVSSERSCPSMRLDSADLPVLAHTDGKVLELKKLIGANWRNYNQGLPPSKLSPAYKTHSLNGFELDSNDNPLVAITGAKENTIIQLPQLWGDWSTVSTFKNGKWSRLGEQLPGYGSLTTHKGKPYVTLVYQKDYFDYDSLHPIDFNNPPKVDDFDQTLRVTVKKYVQGLDQILKPEPAQAR